MRERKEAAEKNSGSSAVFKTGAISLVFLVIGYQAALFINRAALLGIEAARDSPDTVYVVRHAVPSSVSPVSGAGAEVPREARAARETAAPMVPELSADTFRREAAHSPRVQEARRRTRRVESFEFNPNTVSAEELVRLGFSEKQAEAMVNYRTKGGRFRRKGDFAKSFVVSDSIYRRLEPYIRIPLVDINSADSAAFDALPGIGPYFAAKMVEYRSELGGYSYPEQLMDIYNFGRERYDALKDLISCPEPAPFEIWTLPAEKLREHPYIRTWQAARAIVLYRENTPADSLSVEGIAEAGILPEEDASRLARCRIASVSDGG